MLEAIDIVDPQAAAAPTHWAVRDAMAYWEQQCGDRDIPSRADIDPSDIVKLLPNLVLVDVLTNPMDFRYRLIGTAIDEFMSAPYTGKRMSEISHQCKPSKIWESCAQVVETRRPLCSTVPYVGPKRDFVRSDDVILPLGPADGPVNMLMVAIGFTRRFAVPY